MDIDDELEMLQRELMEVQEEKTNPLSERTVAEIIIKLLQHGFKFYATTDGNEYITPEKLDQEIIQFVEERGRTKIGILPQLLSLNPDLVESRINIVCQKSTHVRNGDSLLSKDYLRNFVHSVKHTLEIEGIVQLDEIALAQEFNMPFLMKILDENITELDAEIIGNQLVTKEYRRMKKRRIFGFLLSINRPINIDTFFKHIKISDSNPTLLIEELISEGKLKGRCQNSYYIPDKFSKNQKEMIQKFFESNGFLDFEMLQKNYQVSRPEEWIKKNLKGDFIFIEEVCFNRTKLGYYKSQLESLMKGEGFFEISSVIPFELDDRKMEKFLIENCEITDFILDEGICYSEEWLLKCVNEFRDKVIYEIFFKKNDPKSKKKGAKKEKEIGITEQELVETLFDAGLAEYSVAESMAGSLLPLINERLEKLKTQCQKELTQSQGVITSAFLKYRKCKTIIRSPENLQRVLNTIDKQKKKGNVWTDPDFGPTEIDPEGKFSLIYYDGIFPKEWPEIESIKWEGKPMGEFIETPYQKTKFMSKSILTNLLEIIDNFNSKTQGEKLPTPRSIDVLSKKEETEEEQSSPFTFRFFNSENSYKYVLVDNFIPFINEQQLSTSSLYGLIEKAYAKLRYCYKGILNVGIQQLILEIMGINAIKITIENEKDEEKIIESLLHDYLKKGNLVIVMGEGESGKIIKLNGENTQFRASKPYQITIGETTENEIPTVNIFPGNNEIEAKFVPKMFKNIYIVKGQDQK